MKIKIVKALSKDIHIGDYILYREQIIKVRRGITILHGHRYMLFKYKDEYYDYWHTIKAYDHDNLYFNKLVLC